MIKLLIEFMIAIFLLCQVVPKVEVKIRTEYFSKIKKSLKKKVTISNLKQEQIIDTAKKYLGTPYKFGGTSFKTGIDCSFFVQFVCKENGINLPRTVRAQYAKCIRVWGDPKVGDLVFFQTYRLGPSHVGLVVSNNKFIHASSIDHKVVISKLTDYYKRKYIGTRRILC